MLVLTEKVTYAAFCHQRWYVFEDSGKLYNHMLVMEVLVTSKRAVIISLWIRYELDSPEHLVELTRLKLHSFLKLIDIIYRRLLTQVLQSRFSCIPVARDKGSVGVVNAGLSTYVRSH